jgi:hypothetical protein
MLYIYFRTEGVNKYIKEECFMIMVADAGTWWFWANSVGWVGERPLPSGPFTGPTTKGPDRCRTVVDVGRLRRPPPPPQVSFALLFFKRVIEWALSSAGIHALWVLADQQQSPWQYAYVWDHFLLWPRVLFMILCFVSLVWNDNCSDLHL